MSNTDKLVESGLRDFRRIIETIGSGKRGKSSRRNWPLHIVNPHRPLADALGKLERSYQSRESQSERMAQHSESKLERVKGKRRRNAKQWRERYRREIRDRRRAAADWRDRRESLRVVLALVQGRTDVINLDADEVADARYILGDLLSEFRSVETNLHWNGYRQSDETSAALDKRIAEIKTLIGQLEG